MTRNEPTAARPRRTLKDYLQFLREARVHYTNYHYVRETPPFTPVDGRMCSSEKFDAIRSIYKSKSHLVELGRDSWMNYDPEKYQGLGDGWLGIMTPIERWLWEESKILGLKLWPQFPVGQYFADFAIPDAKVCIECDGSKWHDPARDAIRDANLLAMGWRVLRVPGWKCLKDHRDTSTQLSDTAIPALLEARRVSAEHDHLFRDDLLQILNEAAFKWEPSREYAAILLSIDGRSVGDFPSSTVVAEMDKSIASDDDYLALKYGFRLEVPSASSVYELAIWAGKVQQQIILDVGDAWESYQNERHSKRTSHHDGLD